jgi:hypothetical protein
MLFATFFRDNGVNGTTKGACIAIHAGLHKIYK